MESTEKILIIDDEPNFVEALRMILEARSYTVITTSSEVEAKEMMGSEPNIVVLGTMTPAGQAFAMHQWLKQHARYKDIPLLVIDAARDERQIRGWRVFEGMQLGAEDYVTKPIEPALLLPRIHSLLEELTRIIKILVVDDHTMVRSGVCAVLALQKGMEVVGEAADGQDAVDKVQRLLPNVALMDIQMPGMNGLEATKRITMEYPQTRVLILTQYDEEENMLVARQAGAFGFIPKKAASSELIAGIRAVSGGRYYPPSFAYIMGS